MKITKNVPTPHMHCNFNKFPNKHFPFITNIESEIISTFCIKFAIEIDFRAKKPNNFEIFHFFQLITFTKVDLPINQMNLEKLLTTISKFIITFIITFITK